MRRGRRSTAWAVATLRDHGMAADEIRAVLAANDPAVVHRYLELHRERLDERVAEQGLRLASVERSLTSAILERRGRSSVSDPCRDDRDSSAGAA